MRALSIFWSGRVDFRLEGEPVPDGGMFDAVFFVRVAGVGPGLAVFTNVFEDRVLYTVG